MGYVPRGVEIQVGATTFAGRSHTEIARLIAFDHGWKLYGDQVSDQTEVIVTDTLEELAGRALSLGWFEPSGAGINWHHFGSTKASNADTIRQTSA
jgi:hypothetical protein